MNLKKIFRRTTTILLIIVSLFFSITCHAENPNNAVAYNNRGIDYFEQNQYERAIQEFNKAIQLFVKKSVQNYTHTKCLTKIMLY